MSLRRTLAVLALAALVALVLPTTATADPAGDAWSPVRFGDSGFLSRIYDWAGQLLAQLETTFTTLEGASVGGAG
ncbi:MAG: hypothetical protein R3325_15770 [Thermoanaerobaculia bacterium]|nr:hypothetical protein [Thermoanaerobaculia bacterium]